MGKNIFLITLLSLILGVLPWCYKTHFAETGTINEVDVSPDRTMIVTSSSSERMIVWNFTNLHPIFIKQFGDTVRSSKFSKDQQFIAVGQSGTSQVNIFHASTPFSLNKSFNTGCNQIQQVDWSWDNNRLLVCGGSNAEIYWVGNWSRQLHFTNGNSILTCKFQKDGKIGFGDSDGKISVFLNGINASADWAANPKSGEDLKSLDFDMVNYTLAAVNNDGDRYYIYESAKNGGSQSSIKNSDLKTSTNVASFAKDGSIYAIATDDNIYIYENRTNNQLFNWTGGAESGVFSYDSQYFLAGGSRIVRIFKRMCQSCIAGTYQNSTVCVSCTQAMIGCLNCINSSVCLACGDGYAIDTVNLNCTLCNNTLTGCVLCNSTSICTACSSIYYLLSNACVSCQSISNCLTCTSSSICTSCNTDYYLDGTSKCTTCTTLAGCFTCLNSTACIGCVGGYYLNTTSLTCILCLANCTSCFSSTNCSQCLQGFYLSASNICVICPKNCMKCNSTSCINCISSYYLNGTSCNPCTYSCQTCLNISYCYTCIAGFYSNSGSCSPCIGNCLRCNTSTSCQSCNINYYLASTNTCNRCQNLAAGCLQCTNTICLICQHGYYYSGGSCIKCSQGNGCQRCTNSTYCLSCISGYQYTSSTGVCSVCGIGCSTCNSTSCFSCLPKYYLSSGSCLPCPFNCPTCANSTTCLFCLQGFYLNSTLSCALCNSAINNCVTCTSNAYCTSCDLGYYLNSANSSCIKCVWPCSICRLTACSECAVGYYLNSASCTICPSNCSQCSNATLCTSCINGYYLSSAFTCVSCLTVSHGCQICNRTNCLNCLSNLGFYLNSSTLLCSSCSIITNCLKCSNNGVCTACITGYYISSNTCTLCSNLVSNCQNCNSTVCLSCVDPYYLTASACQLCSQGCYSCFNTTSCKSCLSGYLLQSGACNFCNTMIKGCQICTSTSVCTECQEGYILSGSTCTSCSSFISGCLYCNGTTVCTSCIDQYYLSGTNNCSKCSSTLAGCNQCNSSSICLECLSGYYRNSSSMCSQCSDSTCLQCSNSTYCTVCLSGYFSNSTGSCQQCNSISTGCVLCNSSLCLQCVSGYYLNSSNKCSQCQVVGCQICNNFNSNQCVTCSSLYYLSSTSICISCTLSIEGCINCISSTYCTKCLVGYYLAANFTCQPCFSLFKGCRQCTGVSCSTCQGGYIMNVTTCSSCMQFIPGCQYCISSTVCLSCQSGYFTSNNTCLTCTNITGCLDCSNSSSCNLCSDSYYLNPTDKLCYLCGSSISGCITCSSSTTCKSCLGDYSLSGGICTGIQIISTKPYRQLRMVTQYINSNILKHHLIVRGTTYKKASINLAVNSNITMVSPRTSQILTITSFQWGNNDNQVIFYTNNPLGSSFSSQFKKMPATRLLAQNQRILQSTNVDLNYQFQLQMTQSAIQAILPSSTHSGSLSLKSLADDPSFVRSLYSQKQYNYHYMGLILSILMLIIYFIKAAVTVPNSDDQGQIISHIFLLKCGGIIFSLVYLEYIDYCFGFLTADLYWFNSLTTSLSSRFDLSPNSYLLFYLNMTLASTYLVALCVIAAIAIILILIGWISPQKLESVKVVGMFFYNYFQVGLIIAGSASIQGAYYNNLNYITQNSVFYIAGIFIYLVVGMVNMSMTINNLHRINKMRVFVKATFLSLLYISPIYLLPIAIGVQIVFIIFEYNIKKATKLHPHAWLINQFIVNISFILLVMFSQSLISIYSSFILVVLAVIIDLVIHINQYRHREQIIKVKEIQQLTSVLEKKQKMDKKIKKKNNTIYQSTRKNDTLIINQFDQDISQSGKSKNHEEILNSDNNFLIDDRHMQTGGIFSLEEELQFQEK